MDLRSVLNKLPDLGLSTKKGSSLYNCKNMYNFLSLNHTTSENYLSKELVELRQLLVAKPEVSNPGPTLEYQFLTSQMDKYKDKGMISHVRSVIKVMKGISEDYITNMEDEEFLLAVLDKLAKSKSFDKRKPVLKSYYNYYFEQTGFNILNPTKVKLVRIIRLYNKKITKGVNRKSDTHPNVLEFVSYIKEKNQKWFRQAQIETTAFLKWVTMNGLVEVSDYKEIDVRQIKIKILEQYRKHLENRIYKNELKKESAQVIIRILRRWFDFLKERGFIFQNPYNQVKNFNVSTVKRDFRLLYLEEVEPFFKAILDHAEDPLSDFCLFSMIAATGLRASEALNLKKLDVNLVEGKMKILRKGNIEQTIPIPGEIWLLMELHISALTSDILWQNHDGTELNYESLRKKFHKYMTLAGISEKIGACHFLRHLLFSELCIAGQDLEKIQKLANHSSLNQLNTYLRVRQQQTKNNFMTKYEPVGCDLLWN